MDNNTEGWVECAYCDGMIYLDSTGSFFDPKTSIVYPSKENGTPSMDDGVPFDDCCTEWLEALSSSDESKISIITLVGVSKKGKQRVQKHGSKWLRLGVRSEAEYKALGHRTEPPGPWAFIRAIDGNDMRWINIHADKDFAIEKGHSASAELTR